MWPIAQPAGIAIAAAISTATNVNARWVQIASGSGSAPVSRSGEKIQATASEKTFMRAPSGTRA
ncbi:Uncharacterised protein [Mycobacteroides abscessus]|nr:Uncharacterised protein [Mycobacteroides abscessus]